MQISTYKNRWQTEGNGHSDTTVMNVLRMIKDGSSDWSKAVQKASAYSAAGDHAAYKVAKNKLPVILFNGYFPEGKLSSKLEHASGFAVLDIDLPDDGDTADSIVLRDKIAKDEHTYAVWLSPSLRGVKFLVKIPIVKDDNEFKNRFSALAKHFSEKYNLEAGQMDSTSQNISRLCYFCHDPDLKHNDLSSTFEGIEIPTMIRHKYSCGITNKIGAPLLDKMITTKCKELVGHILGAKDGEKEKKINEASYAFGQYCQTYKSVDPQSFLAELINAGLSLPNIDCKRALARTVTDAFSDGVIAQDLRMFTRIELETASKLKHEYEMNAIIVKHSLSKVSIKGRVNGEFETRKFIKYCFQYEIDQLACATYCEDVLNSSVDDIEHLVKDVYSKENTSPRSIGLISRREESDTVIPAVVLHEWVENQDVELNTVTGLLELNGKDLDAHGLLYNSKIEFGNEFADLTDARCALSQIDKTQAKQVSHTKRVLERMPDWDGVDTAGGVVDCYTFEYPEHTDLYKSGIIKLCRQAVAMAYDLPFKRPFMVVFTGEENNLGKSGLPQWLGFNWETGPDGGPLNKEFGMMSPSMFADGKDSRSYGVPMSSYLICMFDEMKSFKLETQEAFKEILTMPAIAFSAKNQPRDISSARRCVFFGSSNKQGYLIENDNSRYLSIAVSHIDYKKYSSEYTPFQFWAQIKDEVLNQNLSYELTDAEKKELAEVNTAYHQKGMVSDSTMDDFFEAHDPSKHDTEYYVTRSGLRNLFKTANNGIQINSDFIDNALSKLRIASTTKIPIGDDRRINAYLIHCDPLVVGPYAFGTTVGLLQTQLYSRPTGSNMDTKKHF